MGSLAHPLTFHAAQKRPAQRALIVMDDVGVGAAVTDLLAELDYVTWAAADAATAFALAAEISFDLVLADIALTGGALDLATELRRRYANTGIILLADPFDTFPEGIQDFIIFRKPRSKIGACYDPVRYRFH